MSSAALSLGARNVHPAWADHVRRAMHRPFYMTVLDLQPIASDLDLSLPVFHNPWIVQHYPPNVAYLIFGLEVLRALAFDTDPHSSSPLPVHRTVKQHLIYWFDWLGLGLSMTGFLDLPLELRNYVYELLLWEELDSSFRGVMVVSEYYVQKDLPIRCYRGLLRVSRQMHHELKQAIQHMVASKQLCYDLDFTFSHGRPYFSISWIRFPALSPTINQLLINIDLRVREPFQFGESIRNFHVIPHEHELAHLLEDSPESFAGQIFDYIAILLKTLASLLSRGNPTFSVMYTESITLNLRRPTKLIVPANSGHNLITCSRRVPVEPNEVHKMHETMRNTLKATSKGFRAFDANGCDRLSPLIQIGSLRFATEGVIWGEGHNLVLAHDDFQWLRY